VTSDTRGEPIHRLPNRCYLSNTHFMAQSYDQPMDMRQLRYFVVVAEERSVTRAAERLHLTQPPLSAQLARLEHELGVRLLVRHRRGVDLTEAGAHLLERARRLLADADAAADSVRRLGEGRTGRLVCAFVATAGWTVLAELLRLYHAERPDVVLDLLEDSPDAVVEHVRSRRADLGAVYLPPTEPGTRAPARDEDLDVAVLRREPLVAVLPSAWPEAGRTGEPVDLGALSGRTFLAPEPGTWAGLRPHLAHACRLSGFEPQLRSVRQSHTVLALVGAGLGASVLPASVARAGAPRCVARPLARHVPVVELALLRRRAEQPTPQARHFLRLALATPEPDVLAPEHARHPARTRPDGG
jgi:DNA-binding transcriptional LysR family regulator